MSVRARYKGSEVHLSAIQGDFVPGGGVYRSAVQAGGLARQLAIMTAPVRSGELKAAHRRPYIAPAWQKVHVTVANTSDHARYVHEGTTGPITPTRHEFLWIRPIPRSRFRWRTPLPWVRGQRAQPWMARALDVAVRSMYGR